MRILNIDGRYFVRAFQEMGHEVLSVGREKTCDFVLEEVASLRRLVDFLKEREFRPDLVLWADRCQPPSVAGFETLPAPCIGFSIDQYCNPWHSPFSAAFDLMLVAQKDYMGMFQHRDFPRPVEWFPLFCSLSKDVDPGGERDIPVSFVGTLTGSINQTRMDFLTAFKQRHPVFLHQGLYPPVYGRSKIVLNQSAAGEINFRTFEASACGAAVLTEDIANGQAEIFSHGETILTYPRGDAEAAARVARDWLSRPDDLARVADAGRESVVAEHSDRVRAQTIIKHAERLARRHSWQWRFENQGLVRAELSKMFTMLSSDMELPIPQPLRDSYMQMVKMYMSAQ
ncbi:glycosyltransferase [Desulfovibrio ferrophilus]|uniref:Spore protein YkvP/CgeB glycosyl transferase-like domain-containing protein n=1 Tax=Desulfovibrio ferrophilus TaxID=241368 RepID=A0A2Z6AV55_9BACT|nr:glycosyltransferase [Desulfovibrio ferrophilus]BBD07066.1 uncharacterized protein DFE_0340 [Desulfovibrio ferrophilus]